MCVKDCKIITADVTFTWQNIKQDKKANILYKIISTLSGSLISFLSSLWLVVELNQSKFWITGGGVGLGIPSEREGC